MSWVSIILSIIAGMTFILAAVHLHVWVRDRTAFVNLLFSISAASAASIAIMELALMHAHTPDEFSTVLRWMHVPAASIMISIVWFIRSYLGAGRLWLAWSITGLRILVLIINFSVSPNVTFEAVHALNSVTFLGETLSVPVGDNNPWRLLIHLSMLLFLIYVLDAAFAARKIGQGRKALVLGISVTLLIVFAAISSGLMVRGIIPGPFVSIIYLFIVLPMAFELSMDLIHTRQLSRKLTESEERMRLAARAADLGLWDWDVVRDEIWIDDFGTGRVARPIHGSTSLGHYMQLVHPVDRKSLREALDRAIEDDEDFQAEFRMGGPNGGERWIAASGQVERDANGQPLRLRGISIDISTQKKSENALERSRSALTHSQRISAMGQLSMALAHELNQPLGAILRNSEAGEMNLHHDPLDLDELRAIFVDIQNDGQRAAAVINRMRALLKYRELRMKTIALPDLIREVENVLTPELKRRHVTLHIAISDNLPVICGDRVHLQQVLLNLIINSMDAMEKTEAASRHIEILAEPADEGQIEIAVKDMGAGFGPDQLQQLFEGFFTTKSDGMGMGLAICKTIIESHGGHIRAKNNEKSGACVSFTLPVGQDECLS